MVSSTLQARLDVVRGAGTVSAAVLDRFVEMLRTAPEEELFRMSPLRFARKNGIPPLEALELFLRATHAGILEFGWGVICPWCTGFLSTPAGLRALGERRCGLCEVEIPSELHDSVEVAFTVAPAVRRIRFHAPETLDVVTDGVRVMFSGNTGMGSEWQDFVRTHALAGGRVEGSSTHTERTAVPPGRYVVIVPSSNTSARFRATEKAERDDLEIELFDGNAVVSIPEVRAGRLAMTVRNRSLSAAEYLLLADPRQEGVENSARNPELAPILANRGDWLSARRLLTSQTFHELFRAESIPTESGIAVKGLAILFTDLRGSTALYQRMGDLKAFAMVRDHFTLLRECVAMSGGAVVKTIGDAVMAAFSEPREAVEAAVQMHRRIGKVNPGDLSLKVGLHDGPCIAVQLNDRLDYFGTTVNVAARVQAKAHGGEIVVTESTWRAPDVEKLLRAAELTATKEKTELKGIDGETAIVRLRPAAVPA